MCYVTVERYSICRCLYYKHSIDMCAAYGTPGHRITERTVLVGYACDAHTSRSFSEESHSTALSRNTQLSRKEDRKQTDSKAKKTWLKKSLKSRERQIRGSDAEARGNVKGEVTANSADTGESSPEKLKGVLIPISDAFNGVEENVQNASDDENSTDASQIWTELDMQAVSISSAPQFEIASAELKSLLVEHPSLKDLYAPAIALHGHANTREDLRLVIKAYAKALKSSATKSMEYKAGELVRSSARNISYACVAHHDPSAPDIDLNARWEALHKQKTQAAFRVEDYLLNQGGIAPQGPLESNLADLSDDSDREDIGDPLPNLNNVRAFLTSGSPFEQLCEDIHNLSTRESNHEEATFVELQKSRLVKEGPSESSKMIEDCEDPTSSAPIVVRPNRTCASTAYRLYNNFSWWLRSKYWPRISDNCTRIRWHCDCGIMLYEDYATTSVDIISKLSLLIGKPTVATSPSYLGAFGIQSPGNSAGQKNTKSLNTQVYGAPTGNSAHVCPDLDRYCTLCSKDLPKKFLALCINTGRFHKTLSEVDVSHIRRDSEAFRQIKECYLAVHSFRAKARRLFFFRANSVHFVKVNVEDTFRADIVERPSIPPQTEVHAKRYDYSPLDLPLPPISSNSFLHYLENPECESLTRTSRWLGCLPKRLEEQLLSCRGSREPDIIVSGWGIHIDETLNEEALAILALIILVFSASVGVTYSVKTGDAFFGFVIGGYVATVVGVAVTVLYFRWQHS